MAFAIPSERHRVSDVIERSRFITTVSHAASAADARAFIDEMRAEFPDANHNCWAFVAGPPGSTASIGMSDAGEPHGTAGRPMLDVLLHSDIGECAVVVTRYFGGVKLGKGGLVRAYGGCVQQALATLPTIMKVDRVNARLATGYGDIEMMRRIVAEHDAHVIDEAYGENVVYLVSVPATALESLERTLADATAGRLSFHLE